MGGDGSIVARGRLFTPNFTPVYLAGASQDLTPTPIDITARFLRPDFGVVHWSWKIEGDKNPR